MPIAIRPAAANDLPLIASLIRELAAYEQLLHAVAFDEAELGEHLFGPKPYAETIIGEIDGVAQGFALFFHIFSTFTGRPSIYLEDLFVRPEARGAGLGKALLAYVAKLGVTRNCARMDWAVLDWNEPAIGFYRKLAAQSQTGWTVMRLEGAALRDVASG